MTDHLAVAVGTTQGLFIVSDGMPDGPFFKGSYVSAFLQVDRRYYAATIDPILGPTLRSSDDGGQTWSDAKGRLIEFPAETGAKLVQICQLQLDASSPAASGGPGDATVLAGVEPAALFRSADGGATFELVRGLWDHPDRPSWEAGPGGLVLNTILTHRDRPGRILVAVANGGVYRSDDSGETWQARNSGIALRSGGDTSADHGQRVHKLAFDAGSPDVLFAQTDTGVYRSADAGDSWDEVDRAGEDGGVASEFGFPVVGHPVEVDTAFVFPLESEAYPCSPGGRPRVYRTTDGGARWEILGDGLPFQNAHVTVVGDAFTIGEAAPYPLAFGTKAGELFASLDSGETWRLVASELPPVLCVRVLQ
ncbi:MAG: exo-alpha-sialidase [Acidimicrobiales bacterium]|jgi:hypothetical protein